MRPPKRKRPRTHESTAEAELALMSTPNEREAAPPSDGAALVERWRHRYRAVDTGGMFEAGTELARDINALVEARVEAAAAQVEEWREHSERITERLRAALAARTASPEARPAADRLLDEYDDALAATVVTWADPTRKGQPNPMQDRIDVAREALLAALAASTPPAPRPERAVVERMLRGERRALRFSLAEGAASVVWRGVRFYSNRTAANR